MTRLYFAYGTNMNPEQFASRCPASRFIGRATLHGYRFIITVRGYANVVPELGAAVHGVMAELTPRDQRTLDRCEGVAAGIYRKEILRVRPDDGREAMALVYVDNETRIGTPKEGYLERILEGARFHGLSGGTLQGFEAWAGKQWGQSRTIDNWQLRPSACLSARPLRIHVVDGWYHVMSRGKVQLGASKEGPCLSGTIQVGADPG